MYVRWSNLSTCFGGTHKYWCVHVLETERFDVTWIWLRSTKGVTQLGQQWTICLTANIVFWMHWKKCGYSHMVCLAVCNLMSCLKCLLETSRSCWLVISGWFFFFFFWVHHLHLTSHIHNMSSQRTNEMSGSVMWMCTLEIERGKVSTAFSLLLSAVSSTRHPCLLPFHACIYIF